MIIEVFFDVETKKLFSDVEGDDPGLLGVSICSVYRRVMDGAMREVSGEMMSFWEKDFDRMWEMFVSADRIIGFNSIKFDAAALQPYTSIQLKKLKHFDILEKVRTALGHRLSLDSLCRDTLGSGKTDVGTNAVVYFAKGDAESLEKLQKYCEMDVALTRDLYDFGMKNKYLKFTDRWNRLSTVTVDFSYPPRSEKDRQIGLF